MHVAMTNHLIPHSKEWGWIVWPYVTREYLEQVSTLIEECVIPEISSEIRDCIYAHSDYIKFKVLLWLDGIGKRGVTIIAFTVFHPHLQHAFEGRGGCSKPYAVMFVPKNEQSCKNEYRQILEQFSAMHGKVYKHRNRQGHELDVEFDVNGILNTADRAAQAVSSGKPAGSSEAREGFQV